MNNTAHHYRQEVPAAIKWSLAATALLACSMPTTAGSYQRTVLRLQHHRRRHQRFRHAGVPSNSHASSNHGIFTGPDPVADKVIRVGDVLFGSATVNVDFVNGFNDHGDVAFRYALANGRSGIAKAVAPARPVPADFERRWRCGWRGSGDRARRVDGRGDVRPVPAACPGRSQR